MTATNASSVELDDVMLAMDVVDTLRRRDAFVARELDADSRDQALIAKVKRIYASQGIEVDDATIAAGVQALKDQRFAYRAPPAGFKTRLAHFYVQRGRWGKRAGIAITSLLAAWGVYFGAVTLPQRHHAQQEIKQLTSAVATTEATLTQVEQRLQRLQTTLDQAQTSTLPESIQPGAQAIRAKAAQALQQAQQHLTAARDTPLPEPQVNVSSLDQRALQQNLSVTDTQLTAANAQLDRVEHSLEQLAQIAYLPKELARYYSQIKQLAKVSSAIDQATSLRQSGQAALGGGDLKAAQLALSDLKDLAATLQQSYVLQIVSRPGEKSGIWRYPDINKRARNYYLIVEAIGADGRPLMLPMTSEENGQTQRVDKFGLRVDEKTYRQVAQDKQDDGIIQHNKVGIKRPGYLQPDYSIETSGAAITRW